MRKITYELGMEAETPGENLVAVVGWEDGVVWLSSDGGVVEPEERAKFARLRVAFHARSEPQDAGLLAEAFGLELGGGEMMCSIAGGNRPSEWGAAAEALSSS